MNQHHDHDRSTRPRRHVRGPAMAVVALAALALPISVAAAPEREIPPAPDGVEVIGYDNNRLLFTTPFARVYGTTGSGFAVVVGGTILDVCLGNEPPIATLAATQRGDGTWDVTIPTGGIERMSSVYAVSPDEDVFGFFGRVCPEIGAGGDAPEPFATGPTVLTSHQRGLATPYAAETGPQPAGGYQNSLKGEVADADGNRYRLTARAKYEVLQDGSADFVVNALKLQPLG